MNNKLHIVTVATDSEFYFPYLKKSCSSNGINLEVLGFGEKWEGFNWKYAKMIQYLKTIDSNDIVCFVDGYDVICTRNLHNLIDEFYKLKKRTLSKIIVGYNNNNNNNNKYFVALYFGTCNNTLLNSGTYIGTCGDILNVLKEVYNLNPDNSADDQVLLTNYCIKHPKDVYVDVDNELFLSLACPLQELDKFITIIDNKITNNKTIDNKIIYKDGNNNNNPFFVHAPGGGYLDKLIIKLGYDYDLENPINKQIFNKIIKKLPYYANRFFLDNFINFVIVIVLYLLINKLVKFENYNH